LKEEGFFSYNWGRGEEGERGWKIGGVSFLQVCYIHGLLITSEFLRSLLGLNSYLANPQYGVSKLTWKVNLGVDFY